MMSQDAAEWHKLPRTARTCPASLQWRQVTLLVPLGDQGAHSVSRSCSNVGDRAQPGLNKAACVCPAGHWGDQHGDTPHHLCDPRRQRPSCQHCHLVLEGWRGSFKLFQTETQKYISALTKRWPWIVARRGWGWCLCCLFSHGPAAPDHAVVLGGPGQVDRGLSHLQGSLGILRGSFSQPQKAEHILRVSPAVVAWQPLHGGAPHLGTAAHNAEVTPETVDAAYASNTRMVMPGKCWWESFSHSLVPGDPERVPGAGVRQEGAEIFAAAPLFSVKREGHHQRQKSKCTQGKGPQTLGWLVVMPAAGPPPGLPKEWSYMGIIPKGCTTRLEITGIRGVQRAAGSEPCSLPSPALLGTCSGTGPDPRSGTDTALESRHHPLFPAGMLCKDKEPPE